VAELHVEAEEQQGGACVIRVVGDAGLHNAERLDFELARRSTFRPKLAVLDLSKLTFICSLGLGALISFQRVVNRHGGTVRLTGLSARFADVFRRVQLQQVFELHESVDAALAKPVQP
jgi:anti-sigma B factor antagonist